MRGAVSFALGMLRNYGTDYGIATPNKIEENPFETALKNCTFYLRGWYGDNICMKGGITRSDLEVV